MSNAPGAAASRATDMIDAVAQGSYHLMSGGDVDQYVQMLLAP